MIKITLNLPKPYDILIGDGLLGQLGSFIKPYAQQSPVAVLTDKNVWAHYEKTISDSFNNCHINFKPLVLPTGEQSKSLTTLGEVYDFLSSISAKRNTILVALGGGVIGDLSGFTAATWMRGISYIQVPTTLLAQVDSSIGGKTALNLPQGKNLVGAFYQPSLVLIDPQTLKTLEKSEIASGMAEVIKYGAIFSSNLFSNLHTFNQNIIAECCRLKAETVAKDEKDTGQRMLLNFGHTFGHAIEKHYNYETYNHGQAVAFGMVIATSLGEEMGLTTKGTTQKLKEVLAAHNLETTPPCPLHHLTATIATDKKSQGDTVNMVFLREIGHGFLQNISFEKIFEFVEKMEK
ncbi:MAG: 3-dehydroquinate synthase [Candidatus Adiutrix sp.]